MAGVPQARTGLAPAQHTSAPAHLQCKAIAAKCHTHPSACAASNNTQTEPVSLHWTSEQLPARSYSCPSTEKGSRSGIPNTSLSLHSFVSMDLDMPGTCPAYSGSCPITEHGCLKWNATPILQPALESPSSAGSTPYLSDNHLQLPMCQSSSPCTCPAAHPPMQLTHPCTCPATNHDCNSMPMSRGMLYSEHAVSPSLLLSRLNFAGISSGHSGNPDCLWDLLGK